MLSESGKQRTFGTETGHAGQNIKAEVTAQGEDTANYDKAAKIFEKMALTEEFPEFLTLPLYEELP